MQPQKRDDTLVVSFSIFLNRVFRFNFGLVEELIPVSKRFRSGYRLRGRTVSIHNIETMDFTKLGFTKLHLFLPVLSCYGE